MSAREPPMTPSDTGATRTPPSAKGVLEKKDGKANSSCDHSRPAPARSMSDRPTVMMRTSQCVAPMARRMMSRSTAKPSTTADTTATTRASGSGSENARVADQAMKVVTMSISPCAKLSVRVAL